MPIEKISADAPEARSADIVADNIAKLKTLFPDLLTEGKDGVAVDVNVLKQLVGDRTVAETEEKYGLNWHGKRRARQLALTPSTGTLRPCPEESVDWEKTQNLMIEGDNLEVLKLLQKSYSGKVKLIYIDPPYNTGKDFVYPDDFQDNIKNYLELTGQVKGGKKMVANTEASGRFHTDWLNKASYDVGTNEDGNAEIAELFGDDVFSFPKPTALIAKIIEVVRDKDALVLDFFAGSGTMGHAAFIQNKKDGGNRRFILVQIPEPFSDEDKEQAIAKKVCDDLGVPKNIAELTKQRLRLASKKMRNSTPRPNDLGFRVYKLDSSNIREWDPKRDDLAATLEEHAEHLKADRSEADILTEVLLKLGLDLCVPIEQRVIGGVTVHSIGAGALFACLPESITREQVKPLAQGILAWREELKVAVKTEFVFRDSAFADDVAKTNLAAYLEQNLPESQRGRIRSL